MKPLLKDAEGRGQATSMSPPSTPVGSGKERQFDAARNSLSKVRDLFLKKNGGDDDTVDRTALPYSGETQFFDSIEVFERSRKKNVARIFYRLAAFVLAPTLAVTFYLFAFATPRYVSSAEITYQAYRQSASSGLVQSLIGSVASIVDIGSLITEYIESQSLVDHLEEKLKLREYYSKHDIDYLSRLSSGATNSQLLSYYKSHVVSVTRGLGGYIEIDVTSYDPAFAQLLLKEIIEECDRMVDGLTARPRADSVQFAEGEVSRQEARLAKARLRVQMFQNEHRDLDPNNTSSQVSNLVATLETQIAQFKASRERLTNYVTKDSPQLRWLDDQISALTKQIQDQKDKMTGKDEAYSSVIMKYQELKLDEQFAENAYTLAQQDLRAARTDAARKENYLVTFIAPSLPDRVAMSFYSETIASTFLGALLLYFIGSLVIGALRDQTGV